MKVKAGHTVFVPMYHHGTSSEVTHGTVQAVLVMSDKYPCPELGMSVSRAPRHWVQARIDRMMRATGHPQCYRSRRKAARWLKNQGLEVMA